MQTAIEKAIAAQREGRLDEAEKLYLSILKTQPTNLQGNYNLAIILKTLGRLNEAEKYYKKVIELKPDYFQAYYNLSDLLFRLKKLEDAVKNLNKAIELKPDHAEAYSNLGAILQLLGRLNEAEKSLQKAIKLKPNEAQAHNNLGNVLLKLLRFDEAKASYEKAIELKPDHAEAHCNLGNIVFQVLKRNQEAISCYKKAIEFKPDFAEAHNNLGNVLVKLHRFDEAGASYKKAIELKADYIEAQKNLVNTFRKKDLLPKIFKKNNNVNNNYSVMKLISNPFITKRKVEPELLLSLYKINSIEIEKAKSINAQDVRYGNGKCSDFRLFESNNSIIKNAEVDLTKIMSQAVNSEIHILDSFVNIYKSGSGSTPHGHIHQFDKDNGLVDQKYSLTYYLSVGDQNCSEPGILKLYDPEEEILPFEGAIVIMPASRRHSAVYDGKEDRVMIGVNFYSLF